MLAKIESADSVSSLEQILDAVDGAMVARGDLGAELPVEEVFSSLIYPVRLEQKAHSTQSSIVIGFKAALMLEVV